MTLDNVMSKLFEELIPSFLENIPENEKKDYENHYKKLLTEKYSKILAESIINDEIDTDDSLRTIINKEKLLWANATFFNKRQYFNIDDYYLELVELSDEVFNKVIDFYDNGEVELNDMPFDETMKKARKLLEGVNIANLEMGQNQYETIQIDMEYLYGKNEYISSRLNDYIESNPKNETKFHIKRKTVNEIMDNYISNPEALIVKAEEYINAKNYDEAISFTTAFLSILEDKYDDDNENIAYFSFNNVVEQALYIKKYNPTCRIENISYNMAKAYLLIAHALRQKGQNDKALRMIEFSLEWNPIYCSALFEKSMIYFDLKNYEKFNETVDSIYEYIYSAQQLSRYYREKGLYYFTIKDFKTANALYTYSNVYVTEKESEEVAEKRIEEIIKIDSTINEPASYEEIKKVFEEKNIKFSIPNSSLITLKALFNENEKAETYRYVAELLYNLTDDEKYNIKK